MTELYLNKKKRDIYKGVDVMIEGEERIYLFLESQIKAQKNFEAWDLEKERKKGKQRVKEK